MDRQKAVEIVEGVICYISEDANSYYMEAHDDIGDYDYCMGMYDTCMETIEALQFLLKQE